MEKTTTLVILGKLEGDDLGSVLAGKTANNKDRETFSEAENWAKQNDLKADIWFTTGEYDLMVTLTIAAGKEPAAVGFILALKSAIGPNVTTLTKLATHVGVLGLARTGQKAFGHTKMGGGKDG